MPSLKIFSCLQTETCLLHIHISILTLPQRNIRASLGAIILELSIVRTAFDLKRHWYVLEYHYCDRSYLSHINDNTMYVSSTVMGLLVLGFYLTGL